MYPYLRDRDPVGNSHAAPGEGHAGIRRMGHKLPVYAQGHWTRDQQRLAYRLNHKHP